MDLHYLASLCCEEFIYGCVGRGKEGFVMTEVMTGWAGGGGFLPFAKSVDEFCHCDGR